MNRKEFIKNNSEHIRTILVLIMVVIFIVHLYEYKTLLRYDDDSQSESNINKLDTDLDFHTYSIDVERKTQYIDFDINTKRDNCLFQLMTDLFVLSLLYPKKGGNGD